MVICARGENIYPREVEEYLYRHPDIQDVQVFGVPDGECRKNSAPGSFQRPGASIDEKGVREFCQDRIFASATRSRGTCGSGRTSLPP